MLRVLLLSSVIPLVLGVYQFATNTGNHETEGCTPSKGRSSTRHVRYLSRLAHTAPIVYLLHTQSRLRRVAMFVLIPLMVFSIYATQTRVVWIGLVVVDHGVHCHAALWTLLLVPCSGLDVLRHAEHPRSFNDIGSN